MSTKTMFQVFGLSDSPRRYWVAVPEWDTEPPYLSVRRETDSEEEAQALAEAECGAGLLFGSCTPVVVWDSREERSVGVYRIGAGTE